MGLIILFLLLISTLFNLNLQLLFNAKTLFIFFFNVFCSHFTHMSKLNELVHSYNSYSSHLIKNDYLNR